MSKIYIAGHQGMVGAAIHRLLTRQGIGSDLITASRSKLDLTSQPAVTEFFAAQRIDQVYLAAAKVGGIYANDAFPAEFIYQNLMIQCNVIHAAFTAGVKQLLFLGSSCIYPRLANQPIAEAELLGGPLEPTNEPYAVAKIAGIKLCESYNRQYGVDYRSVMPTNLYGEDDNFHPENSHVIPAMMRRFHEAKLAGDNEVIVWGSGTPKREFLYVDDMAEASIHIMNLQRELYDSVTEPRMSHINVGTGVDCSIAELAHTMASVVGFTGNLVFDSSKPDGAPRKLLNVEKLHDLGWHARTNLASGLQQTYNWFLANHAGLRGVA